MVPPLCATTNLATHHMTREWPINIGPVTGGLTLFPYQLALGASIRWGQFRAIRIYLGPFKLWLTTTNP